MTKGSGRVTMQDVAEVAGVTARTVSNVVNDYPFVKKETRARVWDAIEQLGYTMNVSARGLKQGNTRLIALAIPDLTMPYFADLSDAVIAQAQAQGMSVIIEPTASSRQREQEALHRVKSQFAEGIIYCPLEIYQEELDQLSIGAPVVVLSEPIGQPKYDHVMIKNREAARAATEYLIRGGSRRIAAIGLGAGQHRGPAAQRLLGYRDALRINGINLDRHLEITTSAWHRSDGLQAVERLCKSHIPFDGIFAFTDQIAAGVLYALQVKGFKVPDDVAVIGFDNNDESQYLVPALTTVDPGIDEIAKCAVDNLIKRMSADKRQSPRAVTSVDFKLIKRQSTRS